MQNLEREAKLRLIPEGRRNIYVIIMKQLPFSSGSTSVTFFITIVKVL